MASFKKTVLLIVLTLRYMAFGMIVFYHLESPHEEEQHQKRIPLENFTAEYGKFAYERTAVV